MESLAPEAERRRVRQKVWKGFKMKFREGWMARFRRRFRQTIVHAFKVQYAQALRDCYENNAFVSSPVARGCMKISFEVDQGESKATEVTAKGRFKDQPTVTCVLKVVKSMRFRKPTRRSGYARPKLCFEPHK